MPDTPPVNAIGRVVVLLQTVWSITASIVGVGLTVIEKVCDDPAHRLATGVTVTVDITFEVPGLWATKAEILPVPIRGRLMVASLFVQLYEVGESAIAVPLYITGVVEELAHTI